jgi:hypothetical protein
MVFPNTTKSLVKALDVHSGVCTPSSTLLLQKGANKESKVVAK